MARLLRLLFALLFCALLAGCNASRPRWLHPGPTSYQQQRAVLFDPYADNDLGPEVVGNRPPGFQKPRSEPEKANLFNDSWWGAWGSSTPGS